MKIPDLNIGTRLAIGFATVMALAAVLFTVGITHLHEIGRLTTKVIDHDWVKAEAAHTVNSLTRANARRTMELFIVDDPREIAHIRNEIETNRNAISDALQLLDGMVTTPRGRETLTSINQTRNAYVVSFDKVASLIGDEKRAEAAQTLRAETLPLLDRIQGHVVDLVNLQRDLATSGGLAVRERISSAQNMMSVLGATIFLIGIPFAFWITTSITKPISHAVVVAKTVSSGDLTSHIAHHRSDETGQLLMALNEMNTSLENIVGNVRLRAESVATAARQIAAGNMDLSSRTESQASSLEETASSMEELISTVKQNADNVTEANTLANTAREAAIKGGAIVTKVVDTMYGIKGSTSRMEEIIATINGIAFQTNILALNAAVEAARAGEQGKGFAVVAAEVRNLAQRSAAAANEIRGLIFDSVERISAGSALATDAGTAMNDIVLGVRRVTDIMNDITAAGSEQAAGLDQINQAIIHMDQVTQQNAALVEESAAAAQSLQEQAAELAMAVRSFKLRHEAATMESESQTLLVEASGTLSRMESTRNLLTYS